MKIPLGWLSEYVDLKGLSDAEISNALTLSGTENEILSGVKFPGIVVGEVLEVKKHPNADKLQIVTTKISDKKAGILQIVCGAPNVAVGQKVPVATIGTMIGEFEIKEAELRGVKSSGMICSESELGISDDHGGIMTLDPRSKVGQLLSEALGSSETVLEAEITPNRSDCFSMIGIAREAAASLGKKMKSRNFEKCAVSSSKKVALKIEAEKICPRYIAKVVDGVQVGPSPKWLQDRLSLAGVRPINNVVDVTNYVMLEWGQPLHAFDFNKAKKIVVRLAKKGEKIITLDGVERSLEATDLLVTDGKKPIAIAGVMGGLDSEVTPKTQTIVLEAAVFNGTSVRRTAQRLGLRTEASNRFEKGLPLQLPEIAIERAAQLLLDISKEAEGGKASKITVGESSDILLDWPWVQHIGIRPERISQFLGLTVDAEKTLEVLRSLGFEANHFDVKKEARRHVGKPYFFGAKFKTHGDIAFDCSYLTDFLYSQIGRFIGYTSLAQYKLGTPVDEAELLPGDILFVRGHIDKSVVDHYFVPNGKGGYEKVILDKPEAVGHDGIYIGNGRVIHARHYEYDPKNKKWRKLSKGEVIEEPVSVFTDNPEYLGARRYLDEIDTYLAVTVPWWRLDVKKEEDLYEEVGRIIGYDNLPSVLPTGTIPVPAESPTLKMTRDLKSVLAGAGFWEVYNYSFVSEKIEKLFGSHSAMKLANPISPELEFMRTSLAGSLVKNLVLNQDNYEEICIFEIANTYISDVKKSHTEDTYLCLAAKSSLKKGAGYYGLSGAISHIFKALNLGKVGLSGSGPDYYKKGQSGNLVLNGQKIGHLGLVSEGVAEKMGLKSEAAVAEINLNKLVMEYGRPVVFKRINRYPSAVRDINILVAQGISASKITSALFESKTHYLDQASIADIYVGKGLPEGKKSVTIRLVFSSPEKTLTEQEIQTDLNNILKYLEKKVAGKLRQ